MALAMGASFALYAAVHLFDFDLHTWQHNGWFFNPFVWQFLFVAGAWAAMGGAERIGPWLRTRTAMTLAILYLLFSLYVVMGWHIKPLEATVPEFLKKMIYPIDKSYLDPLRVAHFAALVVVVYNLVPHDWRWLKSPLSVAAIRCGEQSLIVYCIGGVPLAFLAGELLKNWSGGIAMQIAVSALGIVFLVALATLVTLTEKATDRWVKLF